MRSKALICLLLLAGLAEAQGPADAVAAAREDIKTVPVELQCSTRYLWVARPSTRFRIVEKLRINLLSRYSEIVDFTVVKPWLWRVRIDTPGWNPGVWENACDTDPFFHFEITVAKTTTFLRVWPGGKSKKDGGKYFKRGRWEETVRRGGKTIVGAPWLPAKELVELRELTYSEAPVLMAEWLFVQSSRQRNLLNSDDSGIGYYDWLDLKDRNDYFKLIDPKADFLQASEIFGREYQAALEKSGISPQNRQLFRYLGRGGGAWVTLDTDKQKGRGIAIKNLRRPDLTGKKRKEGRYAHNTEEWIAGLPNGGPAYFLSTDEGVRQNVAPGDTHGLHDSSTLNESNNKALHVLLSCLQCHQPNVLHPFTDDVRKKYKAGAWTFLASTDPKEDLEFRRLLLSDIYKPLARDEEDYRAFFARATTTEDFPLGFDTAKAIQWYSRQWHSYGTDNVDLKAAARYLGVEPAYWLRSLRNYARPLDGGAVLADTALDAYLSKTPGSLSILTFEDSYPLANQVLAQERAREKKGKP